MSLRVEGSRDQDLSRQFRFVVWFDEKGFRWQGQIEKPAVQPQIDQNQWIDGLIDRWERESNAEGSETRFELQLYSAELSIPH